MSLPIAARARRLFALAALFMATAAPARGAEDSAAVWAEKATYLYKLAPFVEWPHGLLPAPTSPFYICVVGNDAFGRVAARASAGQRLDGHDFVVRRLPALPGEGGCHIVYADGSPGLVAETLGAVRGRPVLTVTDAATGGEARGVFHFVTHQGRVRFEIDMRLARLQGLPISSRVLELAVQVRR